MERFSSNLDQFQERESKSMLEDKQENKWQTSSKEWQRKSSTSDFEQMQRELIRLRKEGDREDTNEDH